MKPGHRGSVNIRQFIKGKRFQFFKTEVIERYGSECAQCGSRHYLSVYFKHWSKFTDLNPLDVIVLCKKHGKEFLKEQESKHYQKWITEKDRKDVSFRYARQLLKNGGLEGCPPKDLILAKQMHIKVKRVIKKNKTI